MSSVPPFPFYKVVFCCKPQTFCLALPNVAFKVSSKKGSKVFAKAWQAVNHVVPEMEAQDLPDEVPSFEYFHFYGVKYYHAASLFLP